VVEWVVLGGDGGEGEGARKGMGGGGCSCGGRGEMSEIARLSSIYMRGWYELSGCSRAGLKSGRARARPPCRGCGPGPVRPSGRAGPMHYPLRAGPF
jgi:hypothetical protein